LVRSPRKPPSRPSPPPFRLEESRKGCLAIRFEGDLTAATAGPLFKVVRSLLRNKRPKELRLDLDRVGFMDDFGGLLIDETRRWAEKVGAQVHLVNTPPKALEMVRLWESDGEPRPSPRLHPPHPIMLLGEAALRMLRGLKELLLFTGATALAFASLIVRPRGLRVGDTLQAMQQVGVNGLPILALISFLLGLIMAFMSAVQLKQFGANIYVASLVALAMTRELGPIMTSILVAGRSGSSFAAEIGTMKISEEVDALFTMGFDPVRFLVVPKVLASIVVVPILALFSNLFAIAGGLFVGVTMLNLTAGAYISQTLNTLTLFDFFWGMGKSSFFGLLIAWIGCLRGFQVHGGPAEVGQATTSAVVSGIFLIILFDSLFAVIMTYWR